MAFFPFTFLLPRGWLSIPRNVPSGGPSTHRLGTLASEVSSQIQPVSVSLPQIRHFGGASVIMNHSDKEVVPDYRVWIDLVTNCGVWQAVVVMDDRPTNDELLAENAELKQRVAELEAQVASLEPQAAELELRVASLAAQLEAALGRIAELTKLLDEKSRAGKRQAAPFSKGPPKQMPKKPGRKSDDDYGTHNRRDVPEQWRRVRRGREEWCVTSPEPRRVMLRGRSRESDAPFINDDAPYETSS